MAEVRFSNAAEADLADIDEFSTIRFGVDISEAYMRGFNQAFARLGDFPMAGPLLQDAGTGIRCLIHSSHRIFYQIEGNEVLIVRVLHHSRDAMRTLQR